MSISAAAAAAVAVAGNFTCEKIVPKCWGCGKEEVKGEGDGQEEGQEERPFRFRQCPKCDDMNLVPSLFCSDECYRSNWPRHKAFHKKMKNQDQRTHDETFQLFEKKLNDHQIGERTRTQTHTHTLNAFDKAMAEGKMYLHKHDFANARRKLRKAQKMNPNSPDVHDSLGLVYYSSGHVAEGLTLIVAAIERWAYNCLTCQSMEVEHNMHHSQEHMTNLCGFTHSIVCFVEMMKKGISQSQEVEYEYEPPDWFRDDFVLLQIIEFSKRISQIACDDKDSTGSGLMTGKEQLQRLHVWHGYTLIGYYHDGKVNEGQPPLDRDIDHFEKAAQCFQEAYDIQRDFDTNTNTNTSRNPKHAVSGSGCILEHYHSIEMAKHVMMSANLQNVLPRRESSPPPSPPIYKGCFVILHGLTSKFGKVETIDCGDGEVGILVEGFEEPTNLKVENVMVIPLCKRQIALLSCLSLNDQWPVLANVRLWDPIQNLDE